METSNWAIEKIPFEQYMYRVLLWFKGLGQGTSENIIILLILQRKHVGL